MFNLIHCVMKKIFLAILCAVMVSTSFAAREDRDDTVMFCKSWVNGVRYAFSQSLDVVSVRIGRAKKCFVLELPNANANVVVYLKSKEHFVVSIDGQCYDYDALDNKQTAFFGNISPEVLKKRLEPWGKKIGYCKAISRHKENVLIIYER